MAEPRTLIIGIGNPDRGDDGAGLVAARLLQERLENRGLVRVIQHWGESTGLVDAMTGWDDVIIIDAASSARPSGSWRVFEVSGSPLPSDLAEMSSHGFGVPQAIELSRALGTLPQRCRVYAIEGATFDADARLSDVVQETVNAVVEDILRSTEAAHA